MSRLNNSILFIRKILSGLGLVAVFVVFSSQTVLAEEVSAEVKAKAQLTLAQWMKDRSDDSGKFYFVDRQANELAARYIPIIFFMDGRLFMMTSMTS